MAQGDVIFEERGVLPIGNRDLKVADPVGKPSTEYGFTGWMRDKFGPGMRIFTYRRNNSGSAIVAGELQSRKLLVVTNLDSGSTTTAVKAATFDAIGTYEGALVMVHDDVGGAGAAPEGESTIVKYHDAATLTFEPTLPLSAALAANDDITLLSKHLVDAADGDANFVVCGIAMTAFAALESGWWQVHGVHPAANHKANTACVTLQPIVADAAAVGPWGADAAYLWIGTQIGTQAADVASTGDRSAVLMTLFGVYV